MAACPVIAVIIASTGRAEILERCISHLEHQVRPPDFLILSLVDDRDLPNFAEILKRSGCPTEVLFGERGSCKQRNRGLDWLERTTSILDGAQNSVLFIDDDFIMRPDWLCMLEREFGLYPEVIGLTGLVLADGSPNKGYTLESAVDILKSGNAVLRADDWRMRSGATESLYGCNMAVRGSAVRNLRFDEALPLYGWLEDFDLSVRLSRKGKLMRSHDLVGVHLGSKTGRTSEIRLGYSQIANPAYFHQKKIMNARKALKYAFNNLSSNVFYSLGKRSHIDRRGRLRGNMIALRDLILRRLSPSRVELL